MLGVDERGDAAGPLRVGDRVQRNRGLAARLRTVDLDDPAAGQAADAERDVESDRPGGDHLDRGAGLVAEPHDGTLAVLSLDLRQRGRQRLVAVETCHWMHPLICLDGRRRRYEWGRTVSVPRHRLWTPAQKPQ